MLDLLKSIGVVIAINVSVEVGFQGEDMLTK